MQLSLSLSVQMQKIHYFLILTLLSVFKPTWFHDPEKSLLVLNMSSPSPLVLSAPAKTQQLLWKKHERGKFWRCPEVTPETVSNTNDSVRRFRNLPHPNNHILLPSSLFLCQIDSGNCRSSQTPVLHFWTRFQKSIFTERPQSGWRVGSGCPKVTKWGPGIFQATNGINNSLLQASYGIHNSVLQATGGIHNSVLRATDGIHSKWVDRIVDSISSLEDRIVECGFHH